MNNTCNQITKKKKCSKCSKIIKIYYIECDPYINIPGEQGPKGIQGIRGIDGIIGIMGEDGFKGEKGDRGERGHCAHIPDDNYYHHNSQNCNNNHNSQNCNNNHTSQNCNNNHIQHCDTIIMCPCCPTGPTGPTGNQGIVGNTGPAGTPGLVGIPGSVGNPGQNGKQGIVGESGLTGPTGDQGPPCPPSPPCPSLCTQTTSNFLFDTLNHDINLLINVNTNKIIGYKYFDNIFDNPPIVNCSIKSNNGHMYNCNIKNITNHRFDYVITNKMKFNWNIETIFNMNNKTISNITFIKYITFNNYIGILYSTKKTDKLKTITKKSLKFIYSKLDKINKYNNWHTEILVNNTQNLSPYAYIVNNTTDNNIADIYYSYNNNIYNTKLYINNDIIKFEPNNTQIISDNETSIIVNSISNNLFLMYSTKNSNNNYYTINIYKLNLNKWINDKINDSSSNIFNVNTIDNNYIISYYSNNKLKFYMNSFNKINLNNINYDNISSIDLYDIIYHSYVDNNVGKISYYDNYHLIEEIFTDYNDKCMSWTSLLMINNRSLIKIPVIFYINENSNTQYELKYAVRISNNKYIHFKIDNINYINPYVNIINNNSQFMAVVYVGIDNTLKYATIPIFMNLTFVLTEQ